MSAIWHDHGQPSFLGIAPSFSFYETAQIIEPVEIACPSYAVAMQEIRIREKLLGDGWFKHNAELSHIFWEMKKPWWL